MIDGEDIYVLCKVSWEKDRLSPPPGHLFAMGLCSVTHFEHCAEPQRPPCQSAHSLCPLPMTRDCVPLSLLVSSDSHDLSMEPRRGHDHAATLTGKDTAGNYRKKEHHAIAR